MDGDGTEQVVDDFHENWRGGGIGQDVIAFMVGDGFAVAISPGLFRLEEGEAFLVGVLSNGAEGDDADDESEHECAADLRLKQEDAAQGLSERQRPFVRMEHDAGGKEAKYCDNRRFDEPTFGNIRL